MVTHNSKSDLPLGKEGEKFCRLHITGASGCVFNAMISHFYGKQQYTSAIDSTRRRMMPHLVLLLLFRIKKNRASNAQKCTHTVQCLKIYVSRSYVSSRFFLPPGLPHLGVKFFYPPALLRCPGPPTSAHRIRGLEGILPSSPLMHCPGPPCFCPPH